MKASDQKDQGSKKPEATKPATDKNDASNLYPEQIPEAQGDLADRANIEIDQEIQEKIMRVRQNIPTVGRSHTDLY